MIASRIQIRNAQKIKLESELKNKVKEISELTSTLSHIYSKLKHIFSPTDLSFELSLLTCKIKKKLEIPDKKREQKLNKLKNNGKIQKVDVVNLSKIKIPAEIQSILEKGLDFAYGGKPRKFQI